MDLPHSTNNKTGIYFAAGAALFLFGAIVNHLTDPYLPVSISNTAKGHVSGFADAKKVAVNSSLGKSLQYKAKYETRMVAGKVTGVSGDTLSLHVENGGLFDDPALAERSIRADANTKVMRIVRTDSPSAKGTSTPSIIQTQIKVTDLHVGESVTVFTPPTGGDSKSFTALSIVAMSSSNK